jgi:Flp pilus assembly protein TadG
VLGQALVEFTLVLPLLLVLFFSVIEFGLYFYTRISLRHVVRESARFAITGNVLTDSAGTPMTRAKSVEHMILTGAPSIKLTPTNITMTPADGGGPGQVVRIDVSYTYTAKLPPFQLFFPNGKLPIKVGTVTKNENY